MFDLDKQVQLWRRSLTDRLRGRPDAVDELEEHLREEVERSLAAGKSPEQAWETALVQLGDPEQLAAEFAKLPGIPFYRWLPARALLIVHAAFALWIGWSILSRLGGPRPDPVLAMHVFAVTLGYTAVMAVGALTAWSIVARAICGWTARESSVLCSAVRWWTGAALVLIALGVVLGSFWAREHMGRFWGWDPKETAALCMLLWNGLVFGLLTWRPRHGRFVMVMGQAGNVVVALCWIAPALLRAGVHLGGPLSAMLLTPMTAFVLVELTLAGLAFVRPGRMRSSSG